MPVEFLCPHCRTRMRTPDDAMKRAITCPSCNGKLRVPVVEINPVAVEVVDPPVPVEVVSPAAAIAPTVTAPVEAAPSGNPFDNAAPGGEAGGDDFDFLGGGAPAAASSSASIPIRKRRRKTPWGLWIFLLLVAACVGAAYVFYGGGPKQLVGSLDAKVVGSGPQSGTVAFPDSLSDADRAAITADLEASPLRFSSASIAVELTASPSGLAFTVQPVEGTRVVEVDPRSNEPLAAFLDSRAAGLDAARQASRDKAIEDMFRDMLATDDGSVRLEAAANYRDPVFLATLQKGLGAAVIANVAGTAVPVMSEADTLRFALAEAVDVFSVEQRPRVDRLPSPFRFRVAVE